MLGDAIPTGIICFYVVPGNKKVNLYWKVGANFDKVLYIIEQVLSPDSEFKEVGSVPANNSYLYELADKDVTNSVTYWYRLVAVSYYGGIKYWDEVVSATPVGTPLRLIDVNAYPNQF